MGEEGMGLMREIHGLWVGKMSVGGGGSTTVLVEDHADHVVLRTGGEPIPPALTAEEARVIARQLNAAADRLDAKRGGTERTDA